MFSRAAAERPCSLLAGWGSVSRLTTAAEAWRVRFCVLRSYVRTAAGHPGMAEHRPPSPPLTAHWLPADWTPACPRRRLMYRVKTGSWQPARERVEPLPRERVGSVGKRPSVVAAQRKRTACPEGHPSRCPACPCAVAARQLVCYRRCRRS